MLPLRCCFTRQEGQGLRITFLGDFRDLSQYTQQILVFPPRPEAATVDALTFAVFLGLEQTQRHLAEPRQVRRTVTCPVPLVILAEANVQDPVYRVLDPPTTAPPVEKLGRRTG